MQILVIEDNAEDAFLILQAFSTVDDCHAFVCRSAADARAYLEGAGMYFDRRKYPLPGAIISDLGLTGESGFQFIEWLRNSPFQNIPAFVLSGSPTTADSVTAKTLGVQRVLQKPGDFRVLQRTLAQLTSELLSMADNSAAR